MGKIKGWKFDGLYNNRNGSKVWVNNKQPNDALVLRDNPHDFGFVVFLYTVGQDVRIRKTFKTKKEAQDYAIKYMRANPNG